MKFNLKMTMIATLIAITAFATVQTQAQFYNDFRRGSTRLNPQNPFDSSQSRTPARPVRPTPPAPPRPVRPTPPAPPKGPRALPQYGALLVGVDQYESLQRRSGSSNDVRAFKKWLKEDGKAAPGNVITLSDAPDVSSKAANGSDIRAAINDAAKIDCDVLFAFFSGNALVFGGETYFCPRDATGLRDFRPVYDDFKGEAARRKLISTADILASLKRARAKHIVVILDVPRLPVGDPNQASREFHENIENLKRGPGRTLSVIMGCGFKENRHETVDDRRSCGLFAHNFLDGLDDADADPAVCYDGNVDIIEAFNYAYSRTIAERGGAQKPEIFLSDVAERPILYSRQIDAPDDDDALEKALYYLQLTTRADGESALRFDDSRVDWGLRKLFEYLRTNPNDKEALAIRAGVYRARGEYEKALEDYRKAGLKLMLYAKTAAGNKMSGEGWKANDLLAISEVRTLNGNTSVVVFEVNGRPLEKKMRCPATFVKFSARRSPSFKGNPRLNSVSPAPGPGSGVDYYD